MINKLFILDANILLQDPFAIFRFQEHDIYLPSLVLAQLDQYKVGSKEESHNARQFFHIIEDLLAKDTSNQKYSASLDLNPLGKVLHSQGQLLLDSQLNQSINMDYSEKLISLVKEKEKLNAYQKVILVTKDIYLRIRGKMLGIDVQNYQSDQIIEDSALLPTGILALPEDFWQKSLKQTTPNSQHKERTWLKAENFLDYSWQINQVIYDENQEYRICQIHNESKSLELETLINFYGHGKNVWGIHAKNREQNICLNFLMNHNIDFITILGAAGTGKTLLALAAGLTQIFEKNYYKEIVITRNTIAIGEDIGFLPGNEEEKMTPWMGALTDNLEILTKSERSNNWLKLSHQDMINHRIKMRAINFMRGRTFLDRYIIIDEAQNLTVAQIKALITRAGIGTKIICLGNLSQIDTPYLNETSSGLTYAIERFQNWPHAAHITLQKGERSRLADFANMNL